MYKKIRDSVLKDIHEGVIPSYTWDFTRNVRLSDKLTARVHFYKGVDYKNASVYLNNNEYKKPLFTNLYSVLEEALRNRGKDSTKLRIKETNKLIKQFKKEMNDEKR